jgi:hypothetical protein
LPGSRQSRRSLRKRILTRQSKIRRSKKRGSRSYQRQFVITNEWVSFIHPPTIYSPVIRVSATARTSRERLGSDAPADCSQLEFTFLHPTKRQLTLSVRPSPLDAPEDVYHLHIPTHFPPRYMDSSHAAMDHDANVHLVLPRLEHAAHTAGQA